MLRLGIDWRAVESLTKLTLLSGRLVAIPFLRDPSKAMRTLTVVAHSTFGYSSLLRLMIARLAGRFGIQVGTRVEMRAWKAVLLPVWRVDIALQGQISVGEKEVDVVGK